jgi:hypothetical protein
MSDLIFRAQAVMTREIEVTKAQLRRNYVTTLRAKPASSIRIPLKSEARTDRSWFVAIMSCWRAEPDQPTAMTSLSTGSEFSTPIRRTIWRKCRGTWSLWDQESSV